MEKVTLRRDTILKFAKELKDEGAAAINMNISNDGEVIQYSITTSFGTLNYYTKSNLIAILAIEVDEDTKTTKFNDTMMLKDSDSTLLSLKSAITSFLDIGKVHKWIPILDQPK